MTSHEVVLRPYEDADFERVMKMWHRTWKYSYPHLNWGARMKWFRWYWKSKLVGRSDIVLAEIDGAIAGFFTLNPADGYVDQVAVVPEEWGRGVSKSLLDEAKRISSGAILLKVNADNHRARFFYEKHGFTYAGEETNSENNKIFLMRWKA